MKLDGLFEELVALLLGVLIGASVMHYRAANETAAKINQAQADNLKRNDEVTNAWARNVDFLRARLRAGDAPRIPVPAATPKAGPAGSADAGTADDVSVAAELETCQAERARLIEDAALTTIQLRELQAWAR